MAVNSEGVLFIITFPREKYEKCLTNRQSSIEEEYEDAKNKLPHNESFSSDSIQGSCLTSNICVDLESNSQNEPEKNVKRDSEEEEICEQQKVLPFKNPRKEMSGSMDSDDFLRDIERQTQMQENQAAVDKFFSAPEPTYPQKDKTMEAVMHEIIEKMQIRNVSWQKVNNCNSYKVCFSLEKGIRCDDTIHLLSDYGIGQKNGSSCVIVPCSVYKDKSHLRKGSESPYAKETSWNRFIGSVRARLNVAKIVESVKSEACLTFDFIILLVVASIVASFGLIEDSSLILIASMLISPLMGPVLATMFGAIIKDQKLQYWGVRNEVIGIVVCIAVGFLFGLIICSLNFCFGGERKLTEEMLSRCTLHSVIVGIFIAISSGAAQSIGLLRDNFGSLVGVAISASLLPPAVNTGLLWSFSCIYEIFKALDSNSYSTFIQSLTYTKNQGLELMILGSISLLVTITNILFIYLSGYVLLRIKIEIAPIMTEQERQFWKHDVPIARDYDKTVNADDGKKMKEDLVEICKHETEYFQGVAAELLRQEFYPYTHTWSPLMYKCYNRKSEPRTSIRDLQIVYQMMAKKKNENSHQHKSIPVKHSAPITTPNKSTSGEVSKPDSLSEPIRRLTTFVDIESTSNESNQEPRKFVVTPSHEFI